MLIYIYTMYRYSHQIQKCETLHQTLVSVQRPFGKHFTTLWMLLLKFFDQSLLSFLRWNNLNVLWMVLSIFFRML